MLSYGQSMFSATLPGCVSWLRCLRGSSARPLDSSPRPILFGGSVKGARGWGCPLSTCPACRIVGVLDSGAGTVLWWVSSFGYDKAPLLRVGVSGMSGPAGLAALGEPVARD